MEPSQQFINQTRLSKRQLQLHFQQQQQAQKSYLTSPHTNYQQQQQPQSRCQYFTSDISPMPHFPPPPEYPPPQQNQNMFEQPSPSQRRLNQKKFHQSDPNSIELYSEYENQHTNNVGVVEPSIRWKRNNIAVTMERYVPAIKHQPAKVHLNHSKTMPKKQKPADVYFDEVYPYGYYQPGQPAPSHQYTSSGDSRETDSSASPPPSSIRALFSTVTRNIMRRASSKFSCDTKSEASTSRIQENIYAEIQDPETSDDTTRSEDSSISVDQIAIAEEIQHVHNNHHRVLSELNLAVEEMLMPQSVDFYPAYPHPFL